MKVLFKTEADSTIGLGHLMRCCSLAAALDGLTKCTCHFDRAVTEQARKILGPVGTRPPAEPLSDPARYDITIIDQRAPKPGVIEALRSRSQLIVWIEDEPGRHLTGDVVIQPNVMKTDGTSCSALLYHGREFILLHPAYQACDPAPLGDSIDRIMICFGGSDPANLSLRITRLLPRVGLDASYQLVLGPCYQHTQAVKQFAPLVDAMSVVEALPTLAEEMASCDLAILSAGTLLYEACAMGRPAIILSQNEEQAQEAAIFSGAGAIIHLGRHDLVDDADVVRAIHRLWKDSGGRRQQAEIARRLIPPGGATRAAERILYHFEQSR